MREELNVVEKVLILAERIRKKSAPGKFYKQTVQSISCFSEENVITIRIKKKINKKTYYWLKNTKGNKYLHKRFFFPYNNDVI